MRGFWDLSGGKLVVELPAEGIWDLLAEDGSKLLRIVGAGSFEVDASLLAARPNDLMLVREGRPAYKLVPWRITGHGPVILLVHGLLRCEVNDNALPDAVYGCARKRDYWNVWKQRISLLCENCDIWEFVYPSHWGSSEEHVSVLIQMLQEEGLLDRGLVLIGHSFGGIVSWRLSHKIDTPAVVVGIASPYRGTPLVDFSYAPVSVIKEWFSDYASYLLAFRSKMFATGSSVISPAHRELFWQIAPLSESPPDILISPWLEVTSDVPLLVETLRDNGGEALVSARLITVMGEVAFGDDLSYNDGVVPMKSSGDGAFISRPVIMHVSGDHETPLISEGVVQRLWQIIAKNYPEVRLDV